MYDKHPLSGVNFINMGTQVAFTFALALNIYRHIYIFTLNLIYYFEVKIR